MTTENLKKAPLKVLHPEYDRAQSFYRKAHTRSADGITQLLSYLTVVAQIEKGKITLLEQWDDSQTTLRHVREFLKQHGFKADSKKQIAADYAI